MPSRGSQAPAGPGIGHDGSRNLTLWQETGCKPANKGQDHSRQSYLPGRKPSGWRIEESVRAQYLRKGGRPANWGVGWQGRAFQKEPWHRILSQGSIQGRKRALMVQAKKVRRGSWRKDWHRQCLSFLSPTPRNSISTGRAGSNLKRIFQLLSIALAATWIPGFPKGAEDTVQRSPFPVGDSTPHTPSW